MPVLGGGGGGGGSSISFPPHGSVNWDGPLNGILTTLDSNQTTHAGNTTNPHNTTAAQVGAIAGNISIKVSTSAPSSPAVNDMWFDATNQIWKRWDGSAWQPTPQTPVGGGTPTVVTPLGTSSDGTSTVAAREDHTHGMALSAFGVSQAWATTTQAIPDQTWTTIAMAANNNGGSGAFSGTPATSTYTAAPYTGLYVITGCVVWSPTTNSGARAMRIIVNGNAVGGRSSANQGEAANSFTKLMYLTAGDQVAVQGYQDSLQTVSTAAHLADDVRSTRELLLVQQLA